MLCIWWDLKSVIYWELLPEKKQYTNRYQINKLEAEVINKGLYNGKIYFKHEPLVRHYHAEIQRKNSELVKRKGKC